MRYLFIFIFLIFGIKGQAQSDHIAFEKYSHLLIQNQNDFWKWRSPTDRYFTNSLYLEHISYKYYDRWKNTWLMKIFPKFNYPDVVNNFGFGLGQDLYTPIDITIDSIQGLDRPYAGYLYLTAVNVSNSFQEGRRIKALYHAGVIGPWSLAQETQEAWHNIIKSPDPQGWGNQIRNDFGFNLNLVYEQRIIQATENIEFIGFADMNVFSTLSNNISAGLHYRFGIFNDYFTNITGKKPRAQVWEDLQNASCDYYCAAVSKDFQIYGFVKTSGTTVLDNSYLEGGVFNRSSPHTISSDEINRFFLNAEFGLRMNYKGYDLVYSQLFRTPEFDGAKTSYWGKIQLIIPTS